MNCCECRLIYSGSDPKYLKHAKKITVYINQKEKSTNCYHFRGTFSCIYCSVQLKTKSNEYAEDICKKKYKKNLQISENVGTKQSGFYLLHVLHVCESVVHAISRIGRGGRNLLAFACRILKICNRKFIPEMPYIFATIISNLDF